MSLGITFLEGLWVLLGLSVLSAYGFIGALIGYHRHETFYTHCDDKEGEYQIVCYLITVFFWPLRFPYDSAHTNK